MSAQQFQEYLQRSRKQDFVRYPAHVQVNNLNFSDYYHTLKKRKCSVRLPLVRNTHSREKTQPEQASDLHSSVGSSAQIDPEEDQGALARLGTPASAARAGLDAASSLQKALHRPRPSQLAHARKPSLRDSIASHSRQSKNPLLISLRKQSSREAEAAPPLEQGRQPSPRDSGGPGLPAPQVEAPRRKQ